MMIPVPLFTPRLSSLWLGLVTPLYARVGRKLIESLRNPTVVTTARARTAFAIRTRTHFREAIARALSREDADLADARWSDALSSAALARPWGGTRFGSRIVDSRACVVSASPQRAFEPIRDLAAVRGGTTATCSGRSGVPSTCRSAAPGCAAAGGTRAAAFRRGVDFWRVEAFEPVRLLRLSAEMQLPGRAWLQFEVSPVAADGIDIRQTAIFDPAGLAGLPYWYGLYPDPLAHLRRHAAHGVRRGPRRSRRAPKARASCDGHGSVAHDDRRRPLAHAGLGRPRALCRPLVRDRTPPQPLPGPMRGRRGRDVPRRFRTAASPS